MSSAVINMTARRRMAFVAKIKFEQMTLVYDKGSRLQILFLYFPDFDMIL